MRVVALSIALLVAAPAWPQDNLLALQDEAVRWLQGYIRVDTTNPPGNEIAGARFLGSILDREGIPYEIVESSPGRGNIWARLKGGSEPALLLLHHMDVVPADRRFWKTDPLSGDIIDGHVYGRGALDTKSSGILHLAAFIALRRAGVPLTRDVIFMGTADEEAGGDAGVGWLVKNRRDLFSGVGAVINEGGSGQLQGERPQFGIEVTQKVPYWFHLTTRDEPGHGSRPLETSAVTRLVAALERLRQHDFEVRLIPAVDTYFKGFAANASPKWRDRYANMASALKTPGVIEELQHDNPGMHALIRNTCSMTRLGGSDKINVIPAEAWAELDCRLLPDQDPRKFIAELQGVLGDDVRIETLMGFTPAVSSADTSLYRVLDQVSREFFPGASVTPSVQTGFTDSHFIRDLGIPAYGYGPIVIPPGDAGGVHGNNERISVENIRRGVQAMREIVWRYAAK